MHFLAGGGETRRISEALRYPSDRWPNHGRCERDTRLSSLSVVSALVLWALSLLKVPIHVRVWLASPAGLGFQWVKLVRVWSVTSRNPLVHAWWNISEPGCRVKLPEVDSRARLVRVWAPLWCHFFLICLQSVAAFLCWNFIRNITEPRSCTNPVGSLYLCGRRMHTGYSDNVCRVVFNTSIAAWDFALQRW